MHYCSFEILDLFIENKVNQIADRIITAILMNDYKNKDKENESGKIAVSCYFSMESIENIDDFLFHVKKRLPLEKRRKLSRSIFYEVGLKTAIQEFNKKGEQSELWKAICAALE